MVGHKQSRTLRRTQPPLHKGEINGLVPSINLVSNDGISKMGQMDANLMLPPGAWTHTNKCERFWVV